MKLLVPQSPGAPHLEAEVQTSTWSGSFLCRGFLCPRQPLWTVACPTQGTSVNSSVQELALRCRWSLPGLLDSALPREKSPLGPSLPETLYSHDSPLPTPVPLPSPGGIARSCSDRGLFVCCLPGSHFHWLLKPSPSTDLLHATPLSQFISVAMIEYPYRNQCGGREVNSA